MAFFYPKLRTLLYTIFNLLIEYGIIVLYLYPYIEKSKIINEKIHLYVNIYRKGIDMEPIKLLKNEIEDLNVEYEIMPFKSDDTISKNTLNYDIERLDELILEKQTEIAKLDTEIDRLTNHADALDYAISVTAGVITGLIDSLIVGEWNFEKAKALSNRQMNEKVMAFAKKKGYKGDRLNGAIKFLENKYPLPGDGAYKTILNEKTNKFDIITNSSHHLDDFCHHPTFIGLICCLIVQFRGETIYHDKFGDSYNLPITVNSYGQLQGKNPVSKLFCGVINWFITCGKTMANAKGHWMSDFAGSGSSKKGGAGLPGSTMSLMKEISSLPGIKDANMSQMLDKLYRHGIGEGKKQINLGVFNSLFEGASSKFDIRTENAIKGELKRQAIPVIINESLVRAFYFIRHFIQEYKANPKFEDMDWSKVIPFNNGTISRMLSISMGTFVAFDLADAAIRSAAKTTEEIAVTGGTGTVAASALFMKNFILRVNFAGIGRFSIAIVTDASMGIKKANLEYKKMLIQLESSELQMAQVFYYQRNMWVKVEELDLALEELNEQIRDSYVCFVNTYKDINDSIERIGSNVEKIKEKNPDLLEEMKNSLKWG